MNSPLEKRSANSISSILFFKKIIKNYKKRDWSFWMKKKVGLVGYRGMVGSVLISRMIEEKDFSLIDPHFFSVSKPNEKGVINGLGDFTLLDASSILALSQMDIILTCQGGDYSKEIFPKLRNTGWKGEWIDAASALRMQDDTIIILDSVNRTIIDKARRAGIKNFIGANCTVSLMLMGIHGLYKAGLVEWVSSMTYQAASGAGAKHMKELLKQMHELSSPVEPLIKDPSSSILEIDRLVTKNLSHVTQENFGAPLAANLIPWIDSPMENGQTREEWKATAEGSKILGYPVLIDGLCVRVGSMRSHAQGLTIKLKKNVPINEIEALIKEDNPWVELISNNKEETLKKLTPAYTSGTLKIPVGRVHKMGFGPEYLTAFTVGDQLLWGAAEPLRRMLRILIEN